MQKQDILENDESLLREINNMKQRIQKQDILSKSHLSSKELDELFAI